MRILFLHPRFPGPFGALATLLAADRDNTVLFLAERGRWERRLPRVRRLSLAAPREASVPQADMAAREMQMALERASIAANALLRLRNDGFNPDIIYAASGGGHSLYARDIFPDSLFAVHAHWFYTKGENYNFFHQGKPRSPVDFAPARARNLLQLNALAECHFAATSTHWQKAQYPDTLSGGMHVLPEGVDCQGFSPSPGMRFVNPRDGKTPVPELVTFSARSTEAARGFSQFYQSLPRLLHLRPQCHVLIMTPDMRSADTLSLHETLMREPDMESRVHICSFRPSEEYRRVLQASSVHVYLTAPFALSSSLFEALSCGCAVVGSDTPPVREVIRHGENGMLCDFWDSNALADTVAALLEHAGDVRPLRQAARQTALDRYDVAKLTPQHARLLLAALPHRG